MHVFPVNVAVNAAAGLCAPAFRRARHFVPLAEPILIGVITPLKKPAAGLSPAAVPFFRRLLDQKQLEQTRGCIQPAPQKRTPFAGCCPILYPIDRPARSRASW